MIRIAEETDAYQIQAIYAPNVRDPGISFESVVPDALTMRQRLVKNLLTHPWLVDVIDGSVAGYCYASPHRERAGWRWCCETTIYVHEDFQRRGVAKRLYDGLLTLLRMQNYVHAFAVIMLPNAPSVSLHERYGFVRRALYPKAGNKHGVWHDVGWWQLALGPEFDAPSEPIAFAKLDQRTVNSVLAGPGSTASPMFGFRSSGGFA